MGLFGTLIHATFDVALIAMCMAGIRRSTGLTLQTGYVNNQNHKKVLGFVVGFGERLFDISVAFMSAYPSVFRRQQIQQYPRPGSPER
ncbi:hypothetical protein IW140_001982 [Coemansia sp. RSA 1813]|nr:hypothetical protein EV178_005560 [Coemansia sp. RSA 1646]KAJ1771598.1 hypothetical protein LPJ74_002152 [Coemansia sp. RSA 1843]KAJ2089902.1 hypothetical protein IW138_003031 [Coemansia sp. RSA 986]KAJ2215218.1 hypothetical protein EV179_002305 [Coemansia sp. RSA 487]KAJ2571027.1 hypothetical protein IW140_001982 [Coemansia sp. RSA 1813]